MDHARLLIAVALALIAAVLTGQVLAARGFPIPAPEKRIGCVDGLRGYLALLVMMHHFDLWTTRTRLGAPWGDSTMLLLHNFGPGGVALFFMATGLVFYPRIVRGFAQVDWRATYVSRVFRILPLQFVIVAVVVAIALAMAWPGPFGQPIANARSLICWATSYAEPPLFGYADAGAINAYVLWSLWYEWMFYLFVLPLLALIRDVTRDRLPRFAIPTIVPLAGLSVGPFLRHPAVVFYLPLFACGMIAFELRERAGVRHLLAGVPAAVVSALLLIVAMLRATDPYPLPQLAAYAVFFACVAAGNSFGGLFAWRGSIVLGEMSFAIYLIHGLALYGLFTFIVPPDLPPLLLYATLPLAAIMVVLISAAAHMVIERPGIALGLRLSGRPREAFLPAVERETANLAP